MPEGMGCTGRGTARAEAVLGFSPRRGVLRSVNPLCSLISIAWAMLQRRSFVAHPAHSSVGMFWVGAALSPGSGQGCWAHSLQSAGFVCSGGNQCRQGGCAWRLASGPICATDHRKASQHPRTVIPCLASRKDAALPALLGSRQKLVVCWVPISVSAPEITRSGNKTLPSLRCLSPMHLSTVHPPVCRAVPLPAAPLWGWQTLL